MPDQWLRIPGGTKLLNLASVTTVSVESAGGQARVVASLTDGSTAVLACYAFYGPGFAPGESFSEDARDKADQRAMGFLSHLGTTLGATWPFREQQQEKKK